MTRLWWALSASYVLAGLAVSWALGSRPLVGLTFYTGQFVAALVLYPVALLIGYRVRSLDAVPAREGYARAWARVRGELFTRAQLLPFLAVGAGAILLLATFTTLKVAVVEPFTWDARLVAWSRTVHGGRLAWEWVHPWLAHPWITRALDWAYFGLWFPIGLGVFVWQAWRPRSPERRRYLLAFVGVWVVLGSIAAVALSSGGPQFYGRIVAGPDPFAGLTAYLDSVSSTRPLIATQVRDWLWAVHVSGTAAAGAGIAAMPSVHVALAELCAIVGRRHGRGLGAALTAYSLLTLVGSVALGAHYAIDGYVSLVAVHVLWWGSGRVVRRG